jgi:four helix bundle protein
MALDARNVALQIIRLLRPLVPRIQKHDPDLARQIRRSANSVMLNVSEADGRIGGDRLQLFRYADGSAREVVGQLESAVAWGYLGDDDVAEVLGLLDRECAMLWRLAGR